ncbi:MAG TPA: hypothetical protein VGJ59_11185 [Jatrophihabitantaceae bacterium]
MTGTDAVGTGSDALTGSEVLAVGRGSFAGTAAAVAVGAAGVGTVTGWAWAGLASSGTSAMVVAAAAAAMTGNATRARCLLAFIGLIPTEISVRRARDPRLAVTENDAQ